MSQLTRINGTNYDITSGKTIIGGTNYNINIGATKIEGTVYDIPINCSGSWQALQTSNVSSGSYNGQAKIIVPTEYQQNELILGLIGRLDTSTQVVYPYAAFLFHLAQSSTAPVLFIWSSLYYGSTSSNKAIISNITNNGTSNTGSSLLGPILWTHSGILTTRLYLFPFVYVPNYNTISGANSLYDVERMAAATPSNVLAAVGSTQPSTTPYSIMNNPTQRLNLIDYRMGTFLRLNMDIIENLTGFIPESTDTCTFNLTSSSVYTSQFIGGNFTQILGGMSLSNSVWLQYK